MKKLFIAAVAVTSLLSAASAEPVLVKAQSISGQTIDAVAGQVIVKYRKGRLANSQARLHQTFSAQALKTLGPLEAEVLKVPAGETVDSFIRRLKDDPDVEFAEPNGIVRSNFAPDDPQLVNQYSTTTLHMAAAWDIARGSANVIVAVLDTGSLFNQAEFAGQFAAGTGTTMGIDWDGNGTYTTDFGCGQGLGKEQAPGAPPLDDNFDDCSGIVNPTGIYHGTRTSSIIGAKTNNTSGMAGIAHGCKLLAVKVLNNKGVGPFDSVANGIVWATTSGAKVINMSLGSSASSSLMDAAVQFALQNDVVVVAAAGNAGNGVTVEYPGAISGVIAVGATDSSDVLANFSCTGNALDLVAPGVAIQSLTSDASGITTIFGPLSGTSFSSPLVAGVAALIRSIAPNLSYLEVTRYLDYFSDDLGSPGFDTAYGFGRLNALKALTAVQNHTAPPAERSTPGKTFPAPNPFNPAQGSVSFYLPSSFGTQDLEIRIINIAGETVKKLDSGCVGSDGLCHWNGRNDDGNFVASGFYLYRAKTSSGNLTGKLTVLK